MKKFLTQKINIAYAIVIVLMLAVGVSSVAASAPGGLINPIIHRGGGDQRMDFLKIGSAIGQLAELDVRQTNSLAHFIGDFANDSSAIMTVSDIAYIGNQLFVGSNVSNPESHIWNAAYFNTDTGAELFYSLQAVNVLGNTRATNLDNLYQTTDNDIVSVGVSRQNQTGSDRVCVDPEGVLQLCTDSPPEMINATCGSAAGTTTPNPPADNLCATGSPSVVTAQTNGTYTWTCTGDNGGTDISCQSNQEVTPPTSISGQCQSFPSAYSSQPANASNGCSAGDYVDVTPNSDTQWLWQCQGTDGGTTDDCVANIDTPDIQNAQCGPSDGQSFNSTPISGLCTVGIPSPVTEDTQPGSPAECNGEWTSSTSGTKIDWNGSPFNWDATSSYTSLYTSDGTKIAECPSNISNITSTGGSTQRYVINLNNSGGAPYYDSIFTEDGIVDHYYCDYEPSQSMLTVTGSSSATGTLYLTGVNANWTLFDIDRTTDYGLPSTLENTAEIEVVNIMQGPYMSGGTTTLNQCSNIVPFTEDYCLNGTPTGECEWVPEIPETTIYEWTCDVDNPGIDDQCMAYKIACNPPTITALNPGTPGDVSFTLGGQTNITGILFDRSNDDEITWQPQQLESNPRPPISPSLDSTVIFDGDFVRARSVCSDGSISDYSTSFQYNA